MANAGQASGLVAAGLGWGIALGVALGTLLIAPALQGSLADAGVSAATSDTDAEAAENTAQDADAQKKIDASNTLLADQAQGIVEGVLDGVAVTLIRTAAASDADAAGVRWMSNAAGASNSGGIGLTEKFFDRDAADELSSIIATTLPAGAQLSVENRSPGTHAGESLAAVLAADPETGEAVAPAGDRAFVLEALEAAGFIEARGPIVPASVLFIVTGEEATDGYEAQALTDLAAALGANARVVLASGSEGPEIEGVHTVPFVGTEAGRIAAILKASELVGAQENAEEAEEAPAEQ